MAILDFRYNHWTDMESCGNPYKQAYKKEMAAACSVFSGIVPLNMDIKYPFVADRP